MARLINSRRCEEDGYTFDSQSEQRRYRELRLMQRAGTITGLQVHPVYVLQPAMTLHNGGKLRQVKFTPDFAYFEDGRAVVEDVKPWKTGRDGKRRPYLTAAFRLRAALFQGKHPEVDFRIVEA